MCSTCKEPKPATKEFFVIDRKGKNGLNARYKSCQAALREPLKSKASEKGKIRRQKHYESIRKCERDYRAAHKAQQAEAVRRWQRENPQKVKIIAHRYRARKKSASGSHTVEDITRLYEAQRGLCKYCGKDISSGYQVDHVMPLSRGGSNWPDNLALACKSCNSSKKDKTLTEWRDGSKSLEV